MADQDKAHEPPSGTGSVATVLPDEALMVRAAWGYYVEGLTQNEIGRKLGLNRVRVNRILAQARERGIVQVRVNSALSVETEAALERKFGLDQAVVVPTPDDVSLIPQMIATAAGAVLSDRIGDGMSVGVGWGRTLRLSVRSVERRVVRDLSVVSLLGGLTRGSVMNAYETASRLADVYDAQCFYIAAPVFADTEETAQVLRSQSGVRDAFAHARNIDIALMSVGSLHHDSTMRQLGLISEPDVKSLLKAGAVGDFCAHWIDANGDVIDHPLNRSVLAMSLDDLRHVPTVILASGGDDKITVLRAALQRKTVSVLVTDEVTAKKLLLPDQVTKFR